ncbi:MAG: ABC transporter ATP-binding protein [Acutalibacteraceae bacterium]|nr:ABC transporter ATP-binding protein [Acutalibacteraceae bacterium]
MAGRNLTQLQKQYSSSGKKDGGRPMGPPGPGRGRGPHGGHGGKPKNTVGTILRLLAYFKPHIPKLIVVLFCMVFSAVTSLIGSFTLLPIINRIGQVQTTEKAGIMAVKMDEVIESITEWPIIKDIMAGGRFAEVLTYVVAAIFFLFTVYLIGILSSYIQARLMLSVTQNTLEKIRNELFQKVQTLPVKYFDQNPTGEIMSRFTNDIDNIDMMLNNSVTALFSGAVTLVGTLFFMITTNWVLTLITVLFIPLFVYCGVAIGKASRKYYSGQQAALGAVNGYIEETVTGQKVIKVFNHEETCTDEFALLNDDMRDKQFKAQFYGGIMGPVTHNVSMISYGVTIGVGGIMMVTSGFTPGALTVFANYTRQFNMPINQISHQMTAIFSALAGAERVFAVMDMESEEADRPGSEKNTEITGYVEIKNLSFGYTEDKLVLKNISLYAKPGQKIAFVGSTGAGKTTITNLLNRFYDTNSGSITIDGVDIKDYPRDLLRRNIAMVLQDTHLFTGTIMENIRYGRLDATDEEVIAAAKTASAHSFITRLEDGYNTMITGDGANLSQGQRQLLNIARAALSKAPILVLDEATSSVDTRTERHIERGMDRLMENRTTFVIAHRLSTVRNSNAIMVLEHGEIIERGDHDDLLKQKGRYYELYTGKKELD